MSKRKQPDGSTKPKERLKEKKTEQIENAIVNLINIGLHQQTKLLIMGMEIKTKRKIHTIIPSAFEIIEDGKLVQHPSITTIIRNILMITDRPNLLNTQGAPIRVKILDGKITMIGNFINDLWISLTPPVAKDTQIKKPKKEVTKKPKKKEELIEFKRREQEKKSPNNQPKKKENK